jgi:hypothetical protein
MEKHYEYPHPLGGTSYKVCENGYAISVHEYAPRHYIMTYNSGGLTKEYRRVSLKQAWQLFEPELVAYRKKKKIGIFARDI